MSDTDQPDEFETFTEADNAAVDVELEAERVLWRSAAKIAQERADNLGLEQ